MAFLSFPSSLTSTVSIIPNLLYDSALSVYITGWRFVLQQSRHVSTFHFKK
ncbi:unnamed protein product, partial [Nesidiocoris tenuis]